MTEEFFIWISTPGGLKKVHPDPIVIPELPQARVQRFLDEYGLTREMARKLCRDKFVADYFEEVIFRDTIAVYCPFLSIIKAEEFYEMWNRDFDIYQFWCREPNGYFYRPEDYGYKVVKR